VSGKRSSLNSACRSKIRSMPFLSPLQDVMNVVLQLRYSGSGTRPMVHALRVTEAGATPRQP
jgi:hypothetical protein